MGGYPLTPDRERKNEKVSDPEGNCGPKREVARTCLVFPCYKIAREEGTRILGKESFDGSVREVISQSHTA